MCVSMQDLSFIVNHIWLKSITPIRSYDEKNIDLKIVLGPISSFRYIGLHISDFGLIFSDIVKDIHKGMDQAKF